MQPPARSAQTLTGVGQPDGGVPGRYYVLFGGEEAAVDAHSPALRLEDTWRLCLPLSGTHITLRVCPQPERESFA